MERNEESGKVMATIQRVAHHNLLLTEAMFELLTEKGLLTAQEVEERIKKLKSIGFWDGASIT
jgi:hypothetical protein